MSNRRSPAKRKSNESSGLSIGSLAPFGIGILLLVVIVGYFVIAPPPTDPKTFCPKDSEGIGRTALLIDVSDKLTSSQLAKLENELRNISTVSEKKSSSFLKKGEKLEVYFVEPEGQRPSLVFSMCHPGNTANRSVIDGLSEGEIFARKRRS